jgi:alpha-N-acetylglucosaminidase
MDTLLASREEYLLGKWITDAKRWGSNETEKNNLEWNARRFITLWGETDWIDDYAGKEWSGLLSDFYAVRWKNYLDKTIEDMQHGRDIEHETMTDNIFNWAYNWSSQKKKYPSEPSGNSIELSRMLLEKYFR